MKICICDDDIQACNALKNMIKAHGSHAITVYHSAEELLFECENHFPFDCIFLDIQMKAMNGIECARRIRQFDRKVNVIFLSVIPDFVFEGYEVNAIRYLLKPLQQSKCFELLDLLESSIQRERRYLYINKAKINCDDILYIESYGHYCGIHALCDTGTIHDSGDRHAADPIETKSSISELFSRLPECFIQTHRSYIVNLDHVESIIKDGCLLSDGCIIPISRNSVKRVNSAFMEYIKGGLL